MDKLLQLRVFVRVSERGSFSAVADELGLTQSAISKGINALENQLDVKLFNRSTRNISLTAIGTSYYSKCAKILRELDEATISTTQTNTEIAGTLNVSVPLDFGLNFISSKVIQLRKDYPQLSIHLDFNNEQINLIERGIDVALRIGHLKTDGLITRKLGESRLILVASNNYLESHGTPKEIKDLTQHECLVYSKMKKPLLWTFNLAGKKQETESILINSNYHSNNFSALKQAALSDLGIAILPFWMIKNELESNQLNHILPEAKISPFGIYAVYPSTSKIPAKVHFFVEMVKSELDNIGYF